MKLITYLILLICCFADSKKCEAQLSARFTASPTNGCSPMLVNFSDESAGNPSEWKWDLGNGTLSTLQNPSTTYFIAGYYTIKLWVKSGSRTDSVTRVEYIHVLNSPSVNFSATGTVGCTPMAVRFIDHTDFTDLAIVSKRWDFGDGILSDEQNPQHIYTQSGNFNVTLKVVAANGCSGTLRKSSFITSSYVQADFMDSILDICSSNKILFQNQSSGLGTLYYNWQFGDGTSASEASVAHTYARPGLFRVTLTVSNQSGCVDSVIRDISVRMPLTASFTSPQPVNCKVPATVEFTSDAEPGFTYYWNFGDGDVSSFKNPTHLFRDTGAYSVRLLVSDSNGCSDSLLMSRYIKVQKTFVNPVAMPDSGCVPFSKNFTADIYSHDSITNYLWNMGNGILLPGKSPVYTFNTPGVYTITLITTSSYGCRDTTTLPAAIKAGNKPTAIFTADTRNDCASTPVAFSDHSTGNITSWEWNFGDHLSSTDQNPIHFYSDTGWMTVELTVRDRGCTDIANYNEYIYLKPAVAKYKVSMECDSPFKRVFNNFSLGAQRWLWDFGDGIFSSEWSPVHYFSHTGTFAVTLKTWNDSTGCSYSSLKLVKVTNVKAAFDATDTSVCKGETVHFQAAADPEIVRYHWDFGDFNSLRTTQFEAAHTYKQSGEYLVRLLVKDSLGCSNTLIKYNYIRVHGADVKFGSSVYDVCLNYPVNFIDSSTASNFNPIIKWEWDYGDGIRDTVFSPPFIHLFSTAGAYRPLLKVTDSIGCSDTFRLARPIKTGVLSSHFFISDSVACPGYALKFVCPYSTPGVIYRWDFGDGQTSSRQTLLHSYHTEGTYTVKLFVSKLNSCTDSTILFNAVRIKQTKADFLLSDSFSTCPPLLVNFTDNSVNATGTYWGFGDSSYINTASPSHFYTYPGSYNVMLIAKGHGVCADTLYKKIVIKGPTGTFSSNHQQSCKPYYYNFIANTENTVSYVWDFDDGATINAADSVVQHLYTDSGTYVPKVIIEDANGCRVPLRSSDTLVNVFVDPHFNFSDSTLCEGEIISFVSYARSNDTLANYVWNFGEGVFSTLQNATHQYNSYGNFYPSLQVTTTGGCVDTFVSSVPVQVFSSPSVRMQNSGSGCLPLPLSLHAFCDDADSVEVKWRWTLGDSDTSHLQHPVHIYNHPGRYTIGLTALSRNGCSSIETSVINVYPSPATVINADTALCRGNSIALHALGAEKYTWLPSGDFSCDTCAVTVAKPVTDTRYVLRGVSENGCFGSDTLYVSVYQPIHMEYKRAGNICRGNALQLSASGANSYKWSPSYGLSSNTSPSPAATPDSSIQYTVIGSDGKGCFSDTGHVMVNVFNHPIVQACNDKTISLGSTVSLEATYSEDVSEVSWSPNDNLSRYDPNYIIVKPAENTEYTVKVKNAGGCAASDRVTVFVICNKNNVFLPTLFSPNNDGVNDIFYPRGIGLLKIQTLRIFNRWGEIVFEKKGFNANDPSAGWDGTFKGSKLITDVFVYVMDLVCENSSILSLKGNVSLVQ